MQSSDLRAAVLEALDHYHDLDALQESPLGKLEAAWPLPPSAAQELVGGLATGVAVRRLLDRALARLGETLPQAAELLHRRYCQQYSIKALSEVWNFVPAAIYLRRDKAITALTVVIADMAASAADTQREQVYRQMEALPLYLRGPLVGFDLYLAQMRDVLRAGLAHPESLLVVTGLGGIGKTSLTSVALHDWLTQENPPIERVLWATIEHNQGWDASTEQALERVLWQLGDQLGLPVATMPNNARRLQALAGRLLQYPQRFILVVDNVETPAEVEVALAVAEPLLRLAQVVITSRREISRPYTRQIRLQELEEPHALELLRLETQRLYVPSLSSTDSQQLYEQVGGHPLALSFVAGQVSRLPVPQVLDSLHRHSVLADELYTHVYETSWYSLSDLARKVLLGLMVLPFTGANWTVLRYIASDWDDAAMERAILELSTLNLLQVALSATQGPTYSLHRLTHRFLEHKTGLAE